MQPHPFSSDVGDGGAQASGGGTQREVGRDASEQDKEDAAAGCAGGRGVGCARGWCLACERCK